MQTKSLKLSRVIAAVALFTAMGCGGGATDGPPRASVSGKVTLDGQPVDGGTIYFTPSKGPMASAPIAAGVYSIAAGDRGPVLGPNAVKIEWYRASGKLDAGGAPLSEQVIPDKYFSKSALTADMKAGSNTHNFELTK